MFGIPEIDSRQLADWISHEQESFSLIDVRGMDEIAQGMLPNAEPLPMHLIPLKLSELRERGKLVLYCRSGARSAQVCAYLLQQGLEHVVNLRGGIVDWYRQGFQIEAPAFSSLIGEAANPVRA